MYWFQKRIYFKIYSDLHSCNVIYFFHVYIYNLSNILFRISAAIIGVIVLYTKYYQLIGLTLICSKSWSGAILTLTSFLMFFMSHDLMTFIRSKTRRWNRWLDHYYILHRFWGYLMFVFAIIHSICHLTGSIRMLSEK